MKYTVILKAIFDADSVDEAKEFAQMLANNAEQVGGDVNVIGEPHQQEEAIEWR